MRDAAVCAAVGVCRRLLSSLSARPLPRAPGEGAGVAGDNELIETRFDQRVLNGLKPVPNLEHRLLIHSALRCAHVVNGRRRAASRSLIPVAPAVPLSPACRAAALNG
jgi:hypothetical protein